jgi:hypothetical protein
MICTMLAAVPPLRPPLTLRTKHFTCRHGGPPASFAACCTTSVPRSDGIESNPQQCTMRAPVSLARAWCASIIARTNWGSPVRSQ